MDLKELKKRVKESPDVIDDEMLLQFLEEYDKTVITNCDTAAMILFKAVIPFCIHKPHLTEQLVKFPIEPLFRLGLDQPSQVFEWVDGYLKNYNESISAKERKWLIEEFPKQDLAIQKYIDYYAKKYRGS